MFSPATSLASGTSAPCSRTADAFSSEWAPMRHQKCASLSPGRTSQPSVTPVGHPQQTAAAASNSGSSSSFGSGSHRTASQQGLQRQAAAGKVLQRAAAAMRPAGPPPEQTTASSSSSSSGRSHMRAHQGGSRVHSSRGHSAAEFSAHALASVGAVAQSADSADTASAMADSILDALASKELQTWGAAAAPSSSSSSHGNGLRQQPAAHSSSSMASSRMSDAQWQLMQHIRQQCHTCEDVAVLYRDASEQFTAQHCAAALYQLTCLWQQLLAQAPKQAQLFTHASRLQKERAQMQQVGSLLLRALSGRMAQAQLRDLADAWYAVDTLGLLQNSTAAADDSAAAVGDSASSGPATASSAAAPANAAFVTASLQRSSSFLQQSQVQLRHLSRLLTSFAHLGINPGRDWWAAALDAAAGGMESLLQQPVQASNGDQPGQQQRQARHSSSSSSSSSSDAVITSHVNTQAVALIGWAVAVLEGPASPAWWQLFQAVSAHLMPVMFSNHLCDSIYALARTQQRPDAAWMQALYAACSRNWGGFAPQGFAGVLWGLAALQQQPSQEWLASLDAASAAKLPQYTLQHLGISLWAMARLQEQPAKQQQQQQAQQQQQRQQAEQQQQVPSAAWQDQAWVQLSRLDLDAKAPQGLACALWGTVRLQLQVPQARMQELEGLCLEALRHMGPQALAVTVWALGNLRGAAVDRRLLRQLRSRCLQEPELLQQLPPQGLCMLLCGLARMDAWHPDSFKQQLLGGFMSQLPSVHQLQSSTKKQRRKQQGTATPQQQQQQDASGISSNSNSAVLAAESLPVVLLHLRRLWIAVPPEALSTVEAALLQQLQALPVQRLCLGLFALAVSKHTAETEFLTAALTRVEGELQSCRALDIAHVLFCLAMTSSWGGDLKQVLQERQQHAQLQKMVTHVQQALPRMDHRSLAMLVWSLGRLQLQPSEPFLQAVMTSTLQQMPNMSLLSVVTIISAFRALHYLPPLPWMVEICSAARAKVSTDSTAKVWQQKDCVRRFEETVAWYNQAVQQQTGSAGVGEGSSSSAEVSVDGEEQQEQQDMQRRRARMELLAASNAGSEGLLAAAVGIAAAVAQRWHP